MRIRPRELKMKLWKRLKHLAFAKIIKKKKKKILKNRGNKKKIKNKKIKNKRKT